MSNSLSFEEIAELQADASAKIAGIRLNHPRQQRASLEILRTRTQGLRRTKRDDPTSGLVMIAGTGATKSQTAKLAMANFQKSPDYDPTKKQIVHVSLGTVGSSKSALTSCLEAISDEYPRSIPNADEAAKKLQIAIEEHGIELIIWDEVNHVAEKSFGKDVADTFKNILTRGWVPLVFMGTEDGNKLFERNRELRRRCTFSDALTAFDPAIDEDFELWASFVAGMDHEIERLGITREIADLGESEVAYALCKASRGLIGELVAILQDTVGFTIERGGNRITVRDLHRAVASRCMRPGFEKNPDQLTHNPFEDLLQGSARS